MAKAHSTILAEHELRLGQVERLLPELSTTLKSIDKKLDTNYVNRREYDMQRDEQNAVNKVIRQELETIKDTMMTKQDFKEYSQSQFWQKVMTFLGGAGGAVLVALAIHAVAG